MKKLILITSAVLIGLTSQATATLTVSDADPSKLAIELRTLSGKDWLAAVATGQLKTSVGLFVKNNTIDDSQPVTIIDGIPLLVEGLYTEAVNRNDFAMVIGKDDPLTVVTNKKGMESKLVSSDKSDEAVLGFHVNVGGKPSVFGPVSWNDYVWTYNVDSDKLPAPYLLWFLEDSPVTEKLRDFNDFIVLGTIGGAVSVVPEPSTIISLIAVGFLGLVTWRNRRKVKA